uniref:TFIIS N-terminal domain-containing protein n=1 Tax=Panagrolaimus davidi TaxID=227884 RepID=A0A914PQG0_9BILA
MKKWLETARSEEQPKRLGMLLAQFWKAEINVDELSKTNIGKLVRELKTHPDSDVRATSNEVLKKWKEAVEDYEMN